MFHGTRPGAPVVNMRAEGLRPCAREMQRLFRQHFWTVQVFFAGLCALILVASARVVLERSSAALPDRGSGGARTRSIAQLAPLAALDLPALARLTGLPVPQVQARVAAPLVDANAAPVKSALALRLVGT